MSDFKVTKSSAVVSSIAYRRAEAPWLTTSGAARVLQLSTEGVRALVRAKELACQWTESGQRIFERKEVERCHVARGRARARHPRHLLADVRPRMLQAGLEPRQARLRVVGEAKGHLRMLK